METAVNGICALVLAERAVSSEKPQKSGTTEMKLLGKTVESQ